MADIKKTSGARAPARKRQTKPRGRARKPQARRAQAANAGMMDQVLTAAEHSGAALARSVGERPLMLLAGAGLIGLIAAMAFTNNR